MALQNPGTELLAVLMEAGKITDEQSRQVAEQAAASGKSIEVELLERKVVDDEYLARTKGTVFGLPYAELSGKDIPAAILNLIPKAAAENNKAIAFDRTTEGVFIGMVNPRDASAMQAVDFLARNVGISPRYHVISNASFAYALKRYAELGKEVETALEVAKERYVPESKEGAKEEKIEEVIKGAPVSRIVSVILRHAVDGNASDIHIEPYGTETRVRYRVDGMLRTSITLPKYIHASLVSRVKVLANMKLDETRIPQDGRITESFNGRQIDFRVSTLPLADTEKVVMRILDTTRGVPTLEQLGFRKQFVDVILEEIRKPHGMLLVTGPTGSGKSTTLFTVMSMRNEEGVNISTLEDPVEYFIRGVNQAQVRPEVGFTFAAGLRALLRQDPNIIMVGEIRDGETGELAVHAALTGHLIFSTLHTNDAVGVVPRLVDMKVEPFLLAAVLNVAIAQRLARKVCERCKSPVAVPPEVEARFRVEFDAIPKLYKEHLALENKPLTFFKGKGCVRCGNTGYTGRVAVSEMIVFNDKLRLLITQGFPMDKAKVILNEMGALTLRQDGLLKALEGSTTIEEVLRVTTE
jgi:type IV pilus assembly protein PilB